MIVLGRKSRSRVRLRNLDRLIFIWLYRFLSSILTAIVIVKPETVSVPFVNGFAGDFRL